MRKLLCLFALFHSVAAVAQITIGDEVLSDPLTTRMASLPFAAPAVAVAKDRTGAVVSWSMTTEAGDRVYVARLDPAGHVMGAVHQLPVALQGTIIDAADPSIAPAPDGSGFVVGWLELDRTMMSGATPMFCRLDAALAPSTPTRLLPYPQIVPSPMVVRTKDGVTWISAGRLLWSLDDAMHGPLAGLPASDMTIATGAPQLIGSHNEKSTTYTQCRQDPGCILGHWPGLQICIEECRIYPTYFSLDFTTLGASTASTQFSFASDAQPAIASNGREVLFAWFRGAQTNGGDVVLSRMAAGDVHSFVIAAQNASVLGSFPADSGQTRPDIATDGVHTIVVWRIEGAMGKHDVVGVVIDSDGKSTPIAIATSPADERDPAILALGGGTFLVAYEKIVSGERHIAGRFVNLGGVKRRAAQ